MKGQAYDPSCKLIPELPIGSSPPKSKPMLDGVFIDPMPWVPPPLPIPNCLKLNQNRQRTNGLASNINYESNITAKARETDYYIFAVRPSNGTIKQLKGQSYKENKDVIFDNQTRNNYHWNPNRSYFANSQINKVSKRNKSWKKYGNIDNQYGNRKYLFRRRPYIGHASTDKVVQEIMYRKKYENW